MEKWYKNLYRRSLVDMHIADWSDEFLSEFDIDSYLQTLKMGKIQAPMIYLQAHTGLCNYPTKTGKMHSAFKDNPYKIRDLIEKCKKEGMSPVGYYSLIFNNWAEDNHPNWAMVNSRGENWKKQNNVRYGLCCPNNRDYRKFVESQIKELSEIFDLPAIFYDMPYWEMYCHCDYCKEKWAETHNCDLPDKIDYNDKNWLDYLAMRQKWMGDFVEFVRDVSKKYMPHTTVEFNFSAVINCVALAGSTELVNEGCDFASGDLYGDLFSHTFACKYYMAVTKNAPFEYMTSRCDPNLLEHTVLKSERKLTREVLLTAAHHGASLIIDAIDPVGTLDKRVYERLGRVFEKQIPHEQYFRGKYISDVAVFFDSTTQFNSLGYDFINRDGCVNSVKKLIANHIPVTVLTNTTFERIDEHKLIIAPTLEEFGNENIPKLIEYVKKGGKLILTSKSESRLMKEFFKGEYQGLTKENVVYIRPVKGEEKYFPDFRENYPMPVKYQVPVYKFGSNVKVLGKLTLPKTDPHDTSIFASIHSNPPMTKSEIPGLVKTSYGKGEVIWMSADIENDSRDVFEHIFMAVVDDLLPFKNRSFFFEGSNKVEATLFEDGDGYIIHFIDLYDDEDIERSYKYSIRMEKGPTAVYNGATKENIEFEYEKGIVSFSGKFTTFLTIKIDF